MCFYSLRRGPNDLKIIFPVITVVLTILGRRSNDHKASNGYISLPWRSAMLHCSDISTKFQFCKSFFAKSPLEHSATFISSY
jgi:hypothetical protein